MPPPRVVQRATCAVFCEQRIANSRLREQHAVWSLSEAGPQIILRMVAVRKLVAKPQTQGEVVLELHGVLHKPRSHPHAEGNLGRRLGYLKHGRSALQEARERGEVHLTIASAQIGALKPFQPGSQGDRVNSFRDAKIVLIREYVVYVELVVSRVRSGTGRSNRGIALRAPNVDLSRRFSSDEWLYPCRRYGYRIKVAVPHARESGGEVVHRGRRKDMGIGKAENLGLF